MLLAATVIIWDEATMASNDAGELVDHLVRNLTGNMIYLRLETGCFLERFPANIAIGATPSHNS